MKISPKLICLSIVFTFLVVMASNVTVADALEAETLSKVTSNVDSDSNPVWSPDGSEILFTRDGDLYRIFSDGSGETKLNNSDYVYSYSWSPDGSKILYFEHGYDDSIGDTIALWVMNEDGTKTQLLEPVGELASYPSATWFPTSSKIAYTFSYDYERGWLWIINSDGSNSYQIGNKGGGANDNIAVSPDESKIVYKKWLDGEPINIYIQDLNQDDSYYKLANGSIEQQTQSWQPQVWSPDGSKIVYCSYEYRDEYGRDSGNYCIYTIKVDGTEKTQLTSDGYSYSPVFSPDGSKILFVSDIAGNDDIWVMDADGNNKTQLTTDPASDVDPVWNPDGTKIAFRSDRGGEYGIYTVDYNTEQSASRIYAYITNYGSDNVSVLDASTNKIIDTVNVGHSPIGVATTPDGKKVYVANWGSKNVSVIDTTTNKVTATVKVGSYPYGVAVNPTGTTVYVTNCWDSNNVSVIDTATDTVTATINVGIIPCGIAVTPDGKWVYVANSGSSNNPSMNFPGNNVSVINTTTNKVIATVNVGSGPVGVAITPDGKKVYVSNEGRYPAYGNNVSVIDTVTNTVTATVTVGDSPSGVAVTPDGKKVYVGNKGSKNVSIIDTATDMVTATVNIGSYPIGIAVSSDGKRVYVANFNSYDVPGNVSVIDTVTNTIITTVEVGSMPYSVGQFISYFQSPEPVTDGYLLNVKGSSEVYLIENGMKRHFTSPEALEWNGYSSSDVTFVSSETLASIPDGTDISISQAIIDKYYALDGFTTFGQPEGTGELDGEADSAGNYCSYVNFQNGAIDCFKNGTHAGEAYAILNPLFTKWGELGYGAGILGYPVSDISDDQDSKYNTWFKYQNFENGEEQGALEWNKDSGEVFEIHGAIFAKWASLGYANSILGFVTTDEDEAAQSPFGTVGKYSKFENGTIHWISDKDGENEVHPYRGKAFVTSGYLNEVHTNLGGTASDLGFPIMDQEERDGHDYCEYEGGSIFWNDSTGVYEVKYSWTDTPLSGKIAFASSRDQNQEIYVINADGNGDQIKLTNLPDADDGDPSWSPDGKQIAFSSNRSGNWKTYIMNAEDGSEQVCILEDVYDAWGPTWSPDEKKIAVACKIKSSDDFEIYTLDIQSGVLTQVTDNSYEDCHPSWSPDSHKIVFTSNRDGNQEIYIADILAGTQTKLTDEPKNDDYPEWSPDGSMIVFVSERDGNSEIYKMDIASKAITRLTDSESIDKHAQWSPDGQNLVFISDRDGGDTDIYVMKSDGTGTYCLESWEGNETHPTWCPAYLVGENASSPEITQKFIEAYDRNGGSSVLGNPTSEVRESSIWRESSTGKGFETQYFTEDGVIGGVIIYNPHNNTAYYMMNDDILNKYIMYTEGDKLGCVASDEQIAAIKPGKTIGNYTKFDTGTIHWISDKDGDNIGNTYRGKSFATYGALDAFYTEIGGTYSDLGFPITDQEGGSTGTCYFENGYIHWDVTGRFVVSLSDVSSSYPNFDFVQITDTHIGDPRYSAQDNLKNIVSELNTMSPKPKFVLVTGDLVWYDNGNKLADSNYNSYFDTFNYIMKTNTIDTKYVPGNHDRRTDPTGTLPLSLTGYQRTISDQTNIIEFDRDGLEFIGLDSGKDYSTDLTPEGDGLNIDQVNYFKNQDKNKLKIIFMHHPAVEVAGVNDDEVTANDDYGGNDGCIAWYRNNFIDYCKTDNVQIVITGHTHRDAILSAKGEIRDPTSTDYPIFIQTNAAANDHGHYRVFHVKNGLVTSEAIAAKDNSHIDTSTACPVNVRVYDSQNRYTGLNSSGEVEIGIPNSFYEGRYNDTEPINISLYDVNNEYRLEVVANLTEEQKNSPEIETFNLTVEQYINKTTNTTVIYRTVPLTENAIAIIALNLTTTDHTMEIDSNGDGVIDETRVPDSIKINGVETMIDSVPPQSITNLQSTSGTTWINCKWQNPADFDFNHTEIYLNGTFQTNTSFEYFNATGLEPETEYTIGTRTVDIYGNVNETWVNGTATTEKVPFDTFEISLFEGWNLISIPLLPEDSSISSVLDPISGNYSIVWAYDSSEGGVWKMYDPSAPIFVNDLKEIKPGKGYWIMMTVNDTLPVSGTLQDNSLQLISGWNLIGYNSLSSNPIDMALAPLSGNYSIVWTYDTAEGGVWKMYDPSAPIFVNDLTEMEPGRGYWIMVK